MSKKTPEELTHTASLRVDILRAYIKMKLSNGLEILPIDIEEIAFWDIDSVLKYFPAEWPPKE
jgi:hypothetical protein